MKKMLCLVLSLILLLSCSALAEEEKEITFQGVPWGSSYEDMLQMWCENGLFNDYVVKQLLAGYSNNMPRGRIEYLTQENGIDVALIGEDYKEVGGWERGLNYFDEVKKIAGYEIKGIDTYWACDDNTSALLVVKVMLKVDDKAAAYDDLTAKLATVYGEYESVKDYEEVNAWIGANNTAVLLTANDDFDLLMANDSSSCSQLLTKNDGDTVALIYGTLDAQEILDAYYAEYQANYVPEPTVNPADTSGL